MQTVEEILVREYFELNGFLVQSLGKARPQGKKPSDEGPDLFLRKLAFIPGSRPPGFLLFASELPYVESAVVCLHGWYGEKAALANMTGGAEILRYVESNVLKKVDKWFDLEPRYEAGLSKAPLKLLVAPVFPTQDPYRAQCVDLLKGKGVDGLLSFKSMLLDLIGRVDTKQVYDKAPSLQLLRTLKTFDLLKDSQMNFLG